MINWEEFWEKICGSFCTANEARKCAENFAQFLRPDFRPSHKNLSAAISLWGKSGVTTFESLSLESQKARLGALFRVFEFFGVWGLRGQFHTSLHLPSYSKLFAFLIQKQFKTVTVTVTVIWGKLIQMTFKTIIGNQWKLRGDCGRQDGNGNGNSSEFQDGNGNGNFREINSQE